MQAICHIEMFGGLRVRVAGQETVRFRTRKVGWLLAYLALRPGRPCTREQLVDVLWPEMDLEAGRDNLSTVLSSLRRHLGSADGALQADRTHVWLEPKAVFTDIGECESLLSRASASEGADK